MSLICFVLNLFSLIVWLAVIILKPEARDFIAGLCIGFNAAYVITGFFDIARKMERC